MIISNYFIMLITLHLQSSTAEEEDYVPPKPETNVVEEKDSFYTKK